MNCIIIDDEPLAIKVIEKYLDYVPDFQCLDTFTAPLAGLVFLQKNEVDLVFLDINMPDLSGLNLLKLLKNTPMVIFTTAYAEYAVESYEYEVLDYLLKPFGLDRFLQAIERARLKKQQQPEPIEEVLLVRADRKIYRVNFERILFLEAYGDYVKIHTDEKVLVPKISLHQLENELPTEHFIRTHRAFIVNKEKVEFLEGNLLGIGEHQVPVSRSLKNEVLTALGL